MDITERFVELTLKWTVAAKLEEDVPCGVYNPACNFQQLQPKSINTLSLHRLWQREPTEPIKQVVGQCVNLHPVGIDDLA